MNKKLEGLSHSKEAYAAAFKVLKLIGSGELFRDTKWNTDSRATSTLLAPVMEKFEFIVTLVVCNEVMQYFHSCGCPCKALLLLTVTDCYQDNHHQLWYNETVCLAPTIGIRPAKKRNCFSNSSWQRFSR